MEDSSTKFDNIKKTAMLAALESTYGRVTDAAKIVGIDRTTHYVWTNEDPAYADAVKGLKDIAIEFVESKLFEKITGVRVQRGVTDEGEPIIYDVPPSDTAIIFYLKTMGKEKGYVEKTQVEQVGDLQNHEIKLPDGTIISIG